MGGLSPISPAAHEPIIGNIERVGAERNIIAYILNKPDAIYDVSLHLQEEDFSNYVNRLVYGHMLFLMHKGARIGQSTLVAMLKQQDKITPEEVDEYLDIVYKTNVANMDLMYNVGLVKCASVKRSVYTEALSIINQCVDDNYEQDVGEFIGHQQKRFLDLGLETKSVSKSVNLGDIVDDVLRNTTNNPSLVPGLQTGFDGLDETIGGLVGGRLYVVVARPKVGKTSILTNWARTIAIENDDPQDILYINTEMRDEEIVVRQLSAISGVPTYLIERGLFATDESNVAKVKYARDLMKQGKLHHVYLPDFSVDKLVSLAWQHHIQYGIKAVFFDYIKLDESSLQKGFNERIAMGRVTNTLKELSNMLNIPVITAAQLNRGADKAGREDEEVSSSMIYGSDDILKFADYIMILRNKTESELASQGIDNGNQVLFIDESRHGGDYYAWLKFDKPTTRYSEYQVMRNNH